MNFYSIDSWVISRFEKFSHWTQRMSGLKSLDWYRICLVACTADFLGQSTKAKYFWWGLLFGMFISSFFDPTPRVPSGSAPTANPAKVNTLRPFRVINFWFAAITFPLHFFGYLEFFFDLFVAAIYFDACDDLPYSLSKLKEFLRSLGRIRIKAPVLGE